VSLEEEKKKGL